jgi:hypothetical protein
MVARMGTDGAAQAASRQPLPAGPAFLRSVSIGLNYCDRLRSLSIVYERFCPLQRQLHPEGEGGAGRGSGRR